MRRLIRLWLNIVVNFSIMPLRLASLLALSMFCLGLILIVATVVDVLLNGADVVGWTSLMSGVLLFGGFHVFSWEYSENTQEESSCCCPVNHKVASEKSVSTTNLLLFSL